MSTILIIEDESTSARLLELVLKREGYTTITATNGLQGLKLAQTQHPDLVLLDLMLPGIDGFEVCNRLRADPSTANVPIIVTTAKSQEADKKAAAKVGANAYLTKPYTNKELVATIEAVLKRAPPVAAAMGTGLAFTSVRGDEATAVITYTALAMAAAGMPVTLADLRPYSINHCLLLNLAPRPTPVALAQRESRAALSRRDQADPSPFVLHPGGLRLLNNLEGSGSAGQITPADANALMDALLASSGYVLIELSPHSVELISEIALRCALMVLVTISSPLMMTAARSMLNTLERIGLSSQQTAVVSLGGQDTPDLGRTVLATLPHEATPDHPAFQSLANRLLGLRTH